MAVKKTKTVKRAKPIQGTTQYLYINKNGHTVYSRSLGDVRGDYVIWNQERDPSSGVITHVINRKGTSKNVMIKSANGSPDARYEAFTYVRNEATKLLKNAKK